MSPTQRIPPVTGFCSVQNTIGENTSMWAHSLTKKKKINWLFYKNKSGHIHQKAKNTV